MYFLILESLVLNFQICQVDFSHYTQNHQTMSTLFTPEEVGENEEEPPTKQTEQKGISSIHIHLTILPISIKIEPIP